MGKRIIQRSMKKMVPVVLAYMLVFLMIPTYALAESFFAPAEGSAEISPEEGSNDGALDDASTNEGVEEGEVEDTDSPEKKEGERSLPGEGEPTATMSLQGESTPGEPGEATLPGINEIATTINTVAAYQLSTVPSPIVNTTQGEWTVVSLARCGKATTSIAHNYYGNLIATLERSGGVLTNQYTPKYTEYSRVVLALSSLGYDARNVAGYDMLAPLAEFENVIWQGVNGPIFALIALDSRSYDVPQLPQGSGYSQTTREGLVSYILSKELSGGGWSLTNSLDVDITGMAIQALAPYYGSNGAVKAAVDRALGVLGAKQSDSTGEWGSTEATVQVVVALSTMGISLDDERFVKNGLTAYDGLMTYYDSSTGAFKHSANGFVDAMSTDQGLYALTSLMRNMLKMNTLYDMSDAVMVALPPEEEIADIKNIYEQLPAIKGIDHESTLYSLQNRVLALSDSIEGKAEIREKIIADLLAVATIRDTVEALDSDIWNMIDSGNITREDAANIRGLQDRYNALAEQDRKHVANISILEHALSSLEDLDKPSSLVLNGGAGNDLARSPISTSAIAKASSRTPSTSAAKIYTENDVIEKSVFEAAQGKDTNIVVEGKTETGVAYKMYFNGLDVTNPQDFQPSVLSLSPNTESMQRLATAADAAAYSFRVNGNLPGKMLMEIETDFADGEYLLFRFVEGKAEYLQRISVAAGWASFLITDPGDYFIAKKATKAGIAELDASDIEQQAASIGGGLFDRLDPVTSALIAAALVTACAISLTLHQRNRCDREQQEIGSSGASTDNETQG